MRFIERIQLENFRCFGTNSVDVELGHVNVFAGHNNVGKSAVLQAIRRLATVNVNRHRAHKSRGAAGAFGGGNDFYLESADQRDSAGAASTKVRLELGSTHLREFFGRVEPWIGAGRKDDANGAQQLFEGQHSAIVSAEFGPNVRTVVDQDRKEPPAEKAMRLLERLPVIVVPESRRLSDLSPLPWSPPDDQVREEIVDGRCVGWDLLCWSAEDHSKLRLVQNEMESALGLVVMIHPSPSSKSVTIKVGENPRRNISELGAGVASVLVVAHALAKYEGGLLLVEEPELHLHPGVQRRLARRLANLTKDHGPWQVLLTTHSNHVLDALAGQPNVRQFVVRRDQDHSHIHPVDPEDLRSVVALLGARAGSLAEANAVIWVEGPSDAIYLRHFLSLHPTPPVENVDYSFAFFGGALLKHSVISRTVIDGFLNLLVIHPHSLLVVDRDAAEGEPPSKAYVQVLLPNIEAVRRLIVTRGKEMENYVPDAIHKACGGYRPGKPNKVNHAEKVVGRLGRTCSLVQLRINEEVDRLVQFIKEACEP